MPTRHPYKDGDRTAGHTSLQEPKNKVELEKVFKATGLAEVTVVREHGQKVRLGTLSFSPFRRKSQQRG